MIDLCSRLGLFNYDARVKSIPIGANRRRGNPGKTKGAFIFQPSDEVNQAVYSASDSENELKEAPKKKGAKPKKAEHSSESEDSDYDLFETTPKATTSKKTAPLQRKAKSKIVENKEKTQKPETSKNLRQLYLRKKKRHLLQENNYILENFLLNLFFFNFFINISKTINFKL